jgi:cyclomaltodextrinase / maltogenic alpha-amylase / neopullulanase
MRHLFLLLVLPLSLFSQGVTWDPLQPLLGQTLTITYNTSEGTLPEGASQVILHWAEYDSDTGNWILPPEENWPDGSSSPDGFALQSPLVQGDVAWTVEIPSTVEMQEIAFVFTDGQGNWDNNSNENWILTYMSDEVICYWSPLEPETGDLLTLTYNAAAGAVGTNPVLHWGINEVGAGNWQVAPEEMWPAGSVDMGDGHAVQTPMVPLGDDLYSLELEMIEGVTALHFVFTNGTQWETNDGANWDIYVGEPPVYQDVWARFSFDPRSALYAGPEPITQVALAGTMNGWNMTATPLTQDEHGVWSVEQVLSEALYQYKFVVNASYWIGDPDNPLSNPDDNNNSMVTLVPSLSPQVTGSWPPSNLILENASPVDLALAVRSSDYDVPLNEAATIVELNGEPIAFSFDGDSLRVELPVDLEVRYDLAVYLEDENAESCEWSWTTAVYLSGWHALDVRGDDDGAGSLLYPVPFGDWMDLKSLHLSQAAGGDSLQVAIEMGLVHDYTRIAFTLMPNMYAPLAGDHIAEELLLPNWQDAGVFVSLLNPGSIHIDAEMDMCLLTSDEPGASVPLSIWKVGETLIMNLPMDLLEMRLGSWQDAWYTTVYAMPTGLAPLEGYVTELGVSAGGLEAAWDCDVYDALSTQPAFIENRLLGNFSMGHTASLDAVGRGFYEVWPEDVGPDMAAPGPRVRILTHGATSVLRPRTLVGTLSENAVGPVHLVRFSEQTSDTFLIDAVNGEWSQALLLNDGLNTFKAQAVDDEGFWGFSSALDYTWFVDHAPQVVAKPSVTENGLRLYGGNTMDVDGDIVAWLWEAEEGNPQSVSIEGTNAQTAWVHALPTVDGAYWFQLTVEDAMGNVGHARALLEMEADVPYPLEADGYPLWVRDAIVYEIFVRSFDPERNISAITNRMAEIADLGVNTLWLMPIFEGPSDHGYAVNDYMSIEVDYGNLEDFELLVQVAHEHGVRVVIDMVLNHSSIDHPWMLGAQDFGPLTQSYDYYAWNPDGTHQYYYDWYVLPNFNVSNPDLKHEINSMSRYWIEEVGVDGYRCDVAWGPMERDPQYWSDWRDSIRRMRPDILLLAEAGATDFSIYDGRFNLAYDWDMFWHVTRVLDTVSPSTVQDRVSNFGHWFPENALPFRFLENHDENRYIADHGVEQTRLAAAFMMAIPGTPLIYAGQEVGEMSPRGLINWSDPHALRSYYKLLCETRSAYPHLRTQRVRGLTNSQPSQIYSMAREVENPAENGVVITAFNLSNSARTATLTLPANDWNMSTGTWYLTDLFTGNVVEFTDGVPEQWTMHLSIWGAKWWMLSDEPTEVGIDEKATTTQSFQLSKPWPNPFNPALSVNLQVPTHAGDVQLEVFNLLGQRVAQLHQGELPAGEHLFQWHAAKQASGVYLLRASTKHDQQVVKAILVK